MKLCIAEKPSVAKEIARIVGATSRRDGYFEGNDYLVSWTFGHLCTLKEPDDYTPSWKSWRFDSLPMIPKRFGIKVIGNAGVQKQFGIIEQLVQQCTEVINCGDAGIEGELIQRWVLTKAQCKKPMKRLWISSLTDEAITEGFQNLKDGADFDLLYAAGNARSIGDWLLGMNATRLYTLKYANGKGVLSIGRVQTPTLALIVRRNQEILNFVPETYWELKTTYRDVTFNASSGRFDSKEQAADILSRIKSEVFTIMSMQTKKGIEQPPRLFDLTSLQVECNRRFSFTAEETLQYIQKLYEKKLVTYPRVDTTFLPNAMHAKIKGILEKLNPYANFTKSLLTAPIKKSKKVFDDKKITDHHAIIPTGMDPLGLNPNEKQVYDTITRRFIAVFYPDCVVANTVVLGETGKIEFKATGKVILKPGWRELYSKKETEGSNSETPLMPQFVKGEFGDHEPDLQEKQTQPPKYYTEATLLRAMETAGKQVDDEELSELMKENGIGRPSTRANIIETLFKRKYVVRQRKNLVPTITGIQLIDTIHNELLKSAELTGLWEKKLRQIENGEYDAKVFLEEMKVMVSEIVLEVKQDRKQLITIHEEEAVQKETPKTKPADVTQEALACPKCKEGILLKGNAAYGCNQYKSGCHFKVSFVQQGKKLSEKQLLTLIGKGKTGRIAGFILDGKKVAGSLMLNEALEVVFQEEKTEPKVEIKKKDGSFTCPKCKSGQMLKGRNAFGCSRYREGCHFAIPFADIQTRFNSNVLSDEVLAYYATH